jgi:hypothetical protein
VAVEVLSGKRPTRPTHAGSDLILTDRIWDLIVRCWGQEPLRRPEISEVVSILERPIIDRQDHPDVAGIAEEVSACLGIVPKDNFPETIRGSDWSFRPTSHRFRRCLSFDMPSPDSRSTLDGFHSIEFNGSETSLRGLRFGELDEPVAPNGLCGLFRRVTFRKQDRGTPSTRNCHGHRGILPEKV